MLSKRLSSDMTLSRLIHPTSVVFIGGNECAVAIRRCHEFGFAGTIHAVHPKRDEISGIRTVKSVDDINGPIDAAFIADEAIQIHGGMGLMSDLPLERIWRDARVERIWEGTSEIQRHIISRALLRPLGG
jgi:Acyl-CoA dehydrogenase, C-terminal domain